MASRGSSKWRTETWGEPCAPNIIEMPIYAGGPRIWGEKRAREAFLRLGAVFLRHGYIVRRAGCYNCRRITGGTSHSSHSWGTSVDVNDDTNPYRRDRLVTDMSERMIADVYAIRTNSGAQVFRWGGDWDGRPETPNSNYDAMHFEIIATPSELAAGIVAQSPDSALPTPIVHWPVIRRGATGSAVTELQNRIGLQRTTGNGTFGPRTEEAVKRYQRAHGLVPDGVAGLATWTALLTQQPALSTGAPSPQKDRAA